MNILLPIDLRSLIIIRRTQNRFISSLSIANKKDEINPVLFYLPEMRFERMTYRLEGGCSIQLSYSGLDPEGLDKRLVLWGTCIIPHKIYVITKIFDCKMFYYFCLRYNLYRLVNRGIKDYANRKSN